MKDYYDIYYIANRFDFDGRILSQALQTTFVNRNRNFSLEQFDQVIKFADDSLMQKKWTAFVRKIDTPTDDYRTVLHVIKSFLVNPFTAAVQDMEYTEHWSAAVGKWE